MLEHASGYPSDELIACCLTEFFFFLFLYQILVDWSVPTELWYHYCWWEGHTDWAGCHQDRAGCLPPVRCPVQLTDSARASPALRVSEGTLVDERAVEWASQWVSFPSMSWNVSSKLVMIITSHSKKKKKQMQNMQAKPNGNFRVLWVFITFHLLKSWLENRFPSFYYLNIFVVELSTFINLVYRTIQ